MAIAYSVSATITRATQFGRNVFRQLGLSSGFTATKEFSATVDLRDLEGKTFPIAVVSSDITEINYLTIIVTGGTANIRIVQDDSSHEVLDFPLSGTMIVSGVSFKTVMVLGAVSSCYCEFFGMGQ
jgi:hypothetical protein